jgi:hypothetical protein
MGVTCTLYRAPENEIQRLIHDPASLGDFLDPDDGSAPRARVVQPKGLLGLVLRLFPITITEAVSESGAPAEASVPDADRSIDLDKGWHGLHFLFTGTAEEG